MKLGDNACILAMIGEYSVGCSYVYSCSLLYCY